jgi:hypothetical protein
MESQYTFTHRLGPETDGSTLARSSSRYDEYDLSTVGCNKVPIALVQISITFTK